jgi:protein-disulfide isomerase-like protein with CxxC motif
MIRGRRSEDLTRFILELFVENRELKATEVCSDVCPRYGLTHKAVNNRLQRLRNNKVLEYARGPEGRAMRLTLHGEYTLTITRAGRSRYISPCAQKLRGYLRWGQRRKAKHEEEGS